MQHKISTEPKITITSIANFTVSLKIVTADYMTVFFITLRAIAQFICAAK
ncbi:hypothetical protein GV51_0329 [Gardnerella vaginalis 5-1]|nr:hypothetical protein GV51_0329 [Gardnerella vaginalis 5-1]